MDWNTLFWLGIFYLLVALLIFLLKSFFRLMHKPKFRHSQGDVSHEVGYFEDPTGRVLTGPLNDEEIHEEGDYEAPHIQSTGNLGSGPM